MVKAKLGQRPICIKSSFDECTLSEIESITNQLTLITTLTDITQDEFDRMEQASRDAIIELLGFYNDYESMPIPDPFKQMDAAEETYEKIEEAKQVLEYKKELKTFIKLARIYMPIQWIESNSVLNVISQGLQIYQSIELFLERHKELNDRNPDESEDDYEEAGVEAIHSYGVFGIIYSICDGKPWLYNQLLKCSAEEVYMTMRYSKDKATFDRNLFKIKSRKSGNLSGNSRSD